MKTYICHWSRLQERKNYLSGQLDAQGFTDVEWVEMYDKDNWNVEEIKNEYTKVFDLNVSGRHLKNSEISLVLKHCYIIKKIADGVDKYGLVLEDDVDLCDNFLEKLKEYISEMPSGWDIGWPGDCCNLSLFHFYREQYIEGKKIYEKSSSRCTHCYVLSKSGANKILKDLPNVCEGADFYYNYLIETYQLNNYWFEPPLATQSPSFYTTIQGDHNS